MRNIGEFVGFLLGFRVYLNLIKLSFMLIYSKLYNINVKHYCAFLHSPDVNLHL